MFQIAGGELGKGLGKNKQGILNPVEAVSKTMYSDNYEIKLKGLEKGGKNKSF